MQQQQDAVSNDHLSFKEEGRSSRWKDGSGNHSRPGFKGPRRLAAQLGDLEITAN